MYIPAPAFAAANEGHSIDSFAHHPKGSTPSVGGWSSTIGVVTAICGNVLISFALNTQRYAHLRLSRDREQAVQLETQRAARTKGSAALGSQAGYGATQQQQQKQVASERAELNAAPRTNGRPHYADDARKSSETQPLIPKAHGRRGSASSEDTIHAGRDHSENGGTNNSDADATGKHGSAGKEKSYLRSPIWWLGISLMVVGEAGNFLAYGFAPASIVSPLGVVALVSNCMIAPFLLGEKFRWRDAFGVLVAIAGCVVVVLSASASNPKLTPDAIWKLISKWEFETYFGITLVLIVALAVASSKIGEKSILIDLGLVGLFGGYTALSTKGVASLLSNTIFRVVTFPITYLLVAVLVFTAIMQIKYVNRALQRFNATMVIPTQFVLFTISVIVGSAVLYRDFERESAEDGIKFVSGCALTFFGVWCITSGHGKDSDHTDDEDEADDSAEENEVHLVDEEDVTPEVRQQEYNTEQPKSSLAFDPSATDGAPHPPQRTQTLDAVPGSHIVPLDVSKSPPPPGLLGFDDVATIKERLSHMSPAAASTIHPHPSTLLQNDASSPVPPPLHATTSAPTVPTTPSLAAANRPKTPLIRTPSGPATDSPTKHAVAQTRNNSLTYAGIDAGPVTPSHRLLARNSVIGLFPGPLTSPLSGSLSAIVADELRRSNSSGQRRKLGKSHSRSRVPWLSQTTANSAAGVPKRHSIASVDVDAEQRREAIAAGRAAMPSGSLPSADGTNGGRMRSLSATLGEIFGSTTRRAVHSDSSRPADQGSDANAEGRGRARSGESAE